MDTKHIKISDYNYDLPDERIAKFPISQRDHSKLLVYNHGEVSDDVFFHLPDYLPKGAMMVFNNTKVIQARMHFRKETGALIEVFLMEPAAPTDYELMFQTSGHCSWLCMIGKPEARLRNQGSSAYPLCYYAPWRCAQHRGGRNGG